MARAKIQSRPARWQAACAEAREAFDELLAAAERFTSSLEELRGVQEEYQEWFDNMPDSLQYNSPMGEKLQAITDLDLDIEVDLSEYEDPLSEAENAELPLGFGRD